MHDVRMEQNGLSMSRGNGSDIFVVRNKGAGTLTVWC